MDRIDGNHGAQKVRELIAAAQSDVFDLARLTSADPTVVSDPTLVAWCENGPEAGRRLMTAPQHLADQQEFTNLTSGLQQRGVPFVRLHLDEPDNRSPYLEWLIEHFRRINIPLGGEIVYLIPAAASPFATHAGPLADDLLIDHRWLVRVIWGGRGEMLYREFYDAHTESDATTVELASAQIAAIMCIIRPGYRLTGIDEDDTVDHTSSPN